MQHKRLVCAVAAAVGFVLAVPAGASAPTSRTFVPGESLGGVRIGMTKAEILRAWGKRHGVCRSCPSPTWYFNERPFEPEGTGVVFERGRVAHLFTVWQPDGWSTRDGLALGDPARRIGELYGEVGTHECDGYTALVGDEPSARSVFYVYREELWAFGLIAPGRSPCL